MALTFFMNKFKYLTIPLALSLAVTAPLAEEMSETGQFVDGVAAVVNEGVVLKSELNRQQDLIIMRATQQDMQLPPADILRDQVLERLVIEEIQMQRADRIGIQISDQMLNTAIAQIAENAGFRFEDMPTILAQDGVEYGEYRRDMRKQMILEQLKRIDVVNRISVSPREIEQCVADLEDNAVVNSNFNLSHIFISVPSSATNEQFSEAEQVATGIYDQLVAGADFGELAVRNSDGDTALEGGSLGWRPGEQLPTLFFDVVGEMEAGDFSAPMRAVSGYHIVKVNEVQGVNQKSEVQQTRIRHILITPDQIIDEETAKQRLDDAVERIQGGARISAKSQNFCQTIQAAPTMAAKWVGRIPASLFLSSRRSPTTRNSVPCRSHFVAASDGTFSKCWNAVSMTTQQTSRKATASNESETAS